MGNRLSKIYTRTGDRGETGLGDGARVPKDSRRVETIGSVDELNSLIGVLLTCALPDDIRATLTRVQHWLFDLGGELSIPGHRAMRAEQVTFLERSLDELNATLAPLKDFILPGGCAAAAYCHLSRAVCRRAERRLVTLAVDETINPDSLGFLNRLSDLLFVMARWLNRDSGCPDVLWEHTPPSAD